MENTNLELEMKLGVKFKNLALLEEAVTHRSFINENKSLGLQHNERLEFLGDAVLELLISEYLFKEYKENPEGDLTSFRAATVRTESLAEASRELQVGKFLKMSRGEESTGGRDKDYLLANVFEAILGAIYLDQGLGACEEFIKRVLVPKISKIVELRLDIDAKTRLQELAQKLYKFTPVYNLVEAEGPDHEKIFTMSVIIAGEEMGRGQGHSKQKAEEEAANQALRVITEKKLIA